MTVIRALITFLTVSLVSAHALAAWTVEPSLEAATGVVVGEEQPSGAIQPEPTAQPETNTQPKAAAQPQAIGSLAALAGERVRFEVSWSGLFVARATFAVVADKDDTFRMTAHTKTRSIVRLLYPVDTTITSIVRDPGFSAVYYAKTGKEGWGKNPQREVRYDHELGQSSYIRNGVLKKKLEISTDVLDPLSVLYYFRLLKEIGEEELVISVCDGKRTITGTVKVVGREKLKTPAGTFDTIIVEPVMEGIGGVFKKSPGATLLVWLSDDALRIPLKVKSDVAVGSFTALATEIVAPQPQAPVLK